MIGLNYLFLLLLGDSISVLASFVLGFYTYHALGYSKDLRPLEFYLGVAVASLLVSLIIFERLGLYKPKTSILNVWEIQSITWGVFFAAAAVLVLSFYIRDPQGNNLSRLILSFSFGWFLLLANLMRWRFRRLKESRFAQGIDCQRVLIYGADDLGQRILRCLTGNPQLGLLPVGMLDEDPSKVGSEFHGQTGRDYTRVRVLGGIEDLDRVVHDLKVDEVFIATPHGKVDQTEEALKACQTTRVRFRFVPHLHGLVLHDLAMEDLDGIPLVRLQETESRIVYEILKRGFDLVFSLLVLICLWPLFVLVAVLVKLETAGPVFFSQNRIGRNGRPFRIQKFRSMHVESAAYDTHPKTDDDPRVTRIGRLLRKYSLDEFPQFINVLLGHMSVVGPRPDMPYVVENYTDIQRRRLLVKPGITGLWQISADRSRPIHENMDYDLYYLHNRGFLLDLIIVLETVLAVLHAQGAR